MNNFNTAIDGAGTTSVAGQINFLCTMLRGEALREFDELANQNSGTTRAHLKVIQEGLLGYFPLITDLYKQKRAMNRVMRKPQDLPLNSFSA